MGKTVVIKYRRNGENFELLADADMAYEYVTGKRTDPMSVLQTEEIFKDAKKGERQSEEKIKKAFGTTEIEKVVEEILKNGDVPITTEQKNKLIEEKRKQIISLIAANSIDPRTNAPNPPIRVENAMNEAKISIDPFKSANDQLSAVVSKLSAYLPLKFSTAKIEVTVPADAANRSYGTLKHYGIKKEDWLSNGSLKVILEIPAGLQAELFDKINKLTQGRAETKIIEQ
ncbi:MAG: ribosome assembly factor SBDS [Candidatus Micrarchaeaceae archaeon]